MVACSEHVKGDPDPQRTGRVHKGAQIRATKEGMSLSDYLLREVTKVAGTLTVQEVLDRARRRGRVELDEDPVDTIRKLRGPLP
jgi:hypothetical protein